MADYDTAQMGLWLKNRRLWSMPRESYQSFVMKRLFVSFLVLLGAVVPAAGWAQTAKAGASVCLVAEFKTLSLSQHDVEQRIRQSRAWLQRNISRCSIEQLSAIQSNSPSWLGHALTPELAGLIEGAVEVKASGNPALMGQLYESLGKEGNAAVDVYKTPTPRAPVVQPPMVMGGVAGAVNYGTLAGPSTSIVNQTGNQNSNQATTQLQNQNFNAFQSPGAGTFMQQDGPDGMR